MSKILIHFIATLILAMVLSIFLPWWSVMIAALITGVFIPVSNLGSWIGDLDNPRINNPPDPAGGRILDQDLAHHLLLGF